MRRPRLLGLVLAVVAIAVLTACAPTAQGLQEGQDFVAQMALSDAYSTTFSAITAQPTPAGSSGWVITRSEPVSGFISAELAYTEWDWWFGNVRHSAFINVVFADRGDGSTAVQIAGSMSNEYAEALAASIRQRLAL